MCTLTHLEENWDEPEPLSKSERPERLVVRGSGLRHDDEKQDVEGLVTRDMVFDLFMSGKPGLL
jgi:hypothetical protein